MQQVIGNSVGVVWERAVLEWEIFDCEEDEFHQSSCICGKENLKYLFTIRNFKNDKMLKPIGSSCIKKFERDDLNQDVYIKEKLFELLHAIENNKFITLSSGLFSRKLLGYLFDDGAFLANSFNNFNPEFDYYFLVDMFNKRDKDNISEAQQKKISAIIMNSIRPYLRSMLNEKIKYRR